MTALSAAVFCTYLDNGYLPLGLALLVSLDCKAPCLGLCALALDSACQGLLAGLGHSALRLLALEEIKVPEFRHARVGCSCGDYCWNLTAFLLGGCSSVTPRRR